MVIYTIIRFILSSIMIRLLKVARPKFLIVGLTLFLLGALWSILLGAIFSPFRLLFGYLVILPAQLSVHFSNDYFDIASDRPDRSTSISGGGGVLLVHPELRQPARWIAVVLILLSIGIGVGFIRTYSYPFWMVDLFYQAIWQVGSIQRLPSAWPGGD
jgi:1,4-dihydroxy-2-naphthoate octaprenyltransferase